MVKISFQPAVAGIKGDKADKASASASAAAPAAAAEILLTPARVRGAEGPGAEARARPEVEGALGGRLQARGRAPVRRTSRNVSGGCASASNQGGGAESRVSRWGMGGRLDVVSPQ